jgi:DNA-binding transcriptional MerR regulator
MRRLTGLTARQLAYWDQTGFFSPQLIQNGRRSLGRIYSFRDVVGLRTIAILRNDHRVPLQGLRRVGTWLQAAHETPWASLTLYVGGGRVYFDDPRTGARMGEHGQPVLPIEMTQIAHSVERDAKQLRKRRGEDLGQISRSRYVAHNAVVVAGTRIPLTAIWNLHDAGYDARAIIREYPTLTGEDISTALELRGQQSKVRAG